MQEKEFDYKGKKIFYRTVGSGPVVMLLHGFPGDGTIWRAQFDLFPDHRLIVPDLPGSGRSEAIDDMSMEGLAEAMAALITSPNPSTEGPAPSGSPVRGETHTHPLPVSDSALLAVSLQSGPGAVDNPPVGGGGAVIGHSLGGYITLALAQKYPERLRAFGLFHSTAFADSEERKEKRRKAIDTVKAQGTEDFLKAFVPNLYSAGTKATRPGLIDEHLTSVRNFSAQTLVSYFEAMMDRPDRTAVLRESAVPVLFVMGAQDAAVPPEDGLKQCHLPQTAYVHLLQEAAHMGMVEAVEETNTILQAFIKADQNTA